MPTPTLRDAFTVGSEFESKADYRATLEQLQMQLLHVQQAIYRANQRAVILFEGTDASGKGGAIRRATATLDPRGYRVHAVGKPHPEEQGRHYLWRFFRHLPPPGRIALFDRSWYGRVLVERVEGLASRDEWQRAYREINELERWLTDDGIRVVKIYLSITKDEQARRFEERLNNPCKHWKLTDDDLRNRQHWDAYVAAANNMFHETHTDYAPWQIINGQSKWKARVTVLQLLVDQLSENLVVSPPTLDSEFERRARAVVNEKEPHS